MTKLPTKFVAAPFLGTVARKIRLNYGDFLFINLACSVLVVGFERRYEMKPSRPYLTDEDIHYEFRIMMRWCRLFRKTAIDWVILEAERFRDRHPVASVEPACEG
jgi:hypothetical protein